jgi:hypothetical protein
MYNAPAAVWNEIAATQKLRFPVNHHRFRMTDAQISAMCDGEYRQLVEAGINKSVVLAYQLVRPLLQEKDAISQWLEATERSTAPISEFRPIGSMREAILIASSEYNLLPTQQEQLKKLLASRVQSRNGLPSSVRQISTQSSEEMQAT